MRSNVLKLTFGHIAGEEEIHRKSKQTRLTTITTVKFHGINGLSDVLEIKRGHTVDIKAALLRSVRTFCLGGVLNDLGELQHHKDQVSRVCQVGLDRILVFPEEGVVRFEVAGLDTAWMGFVGAVTCKDFGDRSGQRSGAGLHDAAELIDWFNPIRDGGHLPRAPVISAADDGILKDQGEVVGTLHFENRVRHEAAKLNTEGMAPDLFVSLSAKAMNRRKDADRVLITLELANLEEEREMGFCAKLVRDSLGDKA
jgi:hypothetical protein